MWFLRGKGGGVVVFNKNASFIRFVSIFFFVSLFFICFVKDMRQVVKYVDKYVKMKIEEFE